MFLSNAAIKNRTTVFVLVFGLIVAGAMSYISLPLESAPDVKIPYILITTVHPGVSPADIENTITNEIEEKLSGLKGMKEFKSTSSEGLSQIVVEFHSDVEIDNALQRVKDKVDLARPELPKNTDDPVEPVVNEINLAERPIMFVSMSGGISQATMKLIAEDLEDEIETIPGVLAVDLLGVLEREIVVEADLDRIVAYGIPVDRFFRAVAGENVNQSAGGLETEGVKFNVRVPAEFEKPREFFDLPLGTRGGKPIYLSDVARVRDRFKDRTTISRLDGQTSVTLAIRKRVGANIVDIAGRVKAILREAKKRVPGGLSFEITMDESDQIKMMVRDLENNILTALVLVVVVLVIVMGIRTSLIVATVIPLSMLMSFAIIQALGMTLNMVVLFSLILALGMLVDNAIVIVENIFRHMEMGYDRMEAAMKGVAEVAWPVIASTATTLAAFTPLLFWPGIMGDFMKYLPMTVMIVLGSSLFAALVVNPVICSVFARAVSRGRRPAAGGRARRPVHARLSPPAGNRPGPPADHADAGGLPAGNHRAGLFSAGRRRRTVSRGGPEPGDRRYPRPPGNQHLENRRADEDGRVAAGAIPAGFRRGGELRIAGGHGGRERRGRLHGPVAGVPLREPDDRLSRLRRPAAPVR